MAVNNPFIRYKIYSTTTNPRETSKPNSEVRVICYVSRSQKDLQPFLAKVLSAAKITVNEYHVVLLDADEVVFAADQGWVGTVDHIFLFGLPGTSAGLQLNPGHYTINDIKGSKIIQLPTLTRIESDKNEKQKLWSLLQKEFLNA